MVVRGTISRVYPRMYGGNPYPYPEYQLSWGLSPYVRGKPPHFFFLGYQIGSIPVCTGETCPSRRRPDRIWVYPRMYGGNISEQPRPSLIVGLSPYVRGKHEVNLTWSGVDGSIPVCTGETYQNSHDLPL